MTTAHVAIITLTYTTKHTYFSHTCIIFNSAGGGPGSIIMLFTY